MGEKCIRKDDIVDRNHLLKKYGGLQFFDEENDNDVITISDTEMVFTSKRGKQRGWKLVGYAPEYDPNNVRDEDWDHWPINHHLMGYICEYYKENNSPRVFVETNPKSLDKDGDWIYGKVNPLDVVEESSSSDEEPKKAQKKRGRNGQPKRG